MSIRHSSQYTFLQQEVVLSPKDKPATDITGHSHFCLLLITTSKGKEGSRPLIASPTLWSPLQSRTDLRHAKDGKSSRLLVAGQGFCWWGCHSMPTLALPFRRRQENRDVFCCLFVETALQLSTFVRNTPRSTSGFATESTRRPCRS